MMQTIQKTIRAILFLGLAVALFGPAAALAAQGEFVVATQSASGSTLAVGWVRFAESVSGGGNNAGVFDIRWTGTNIGGHARISIGANSNEEAQIGMVLNDASSQGSPAINKVRLLEGVSGTTMYLEANVSVALLSLDFIQEAGYGWTLKTPAAGNATGFTTHEQDITAAFAVNETGPITGKSFKVAKDGTVTIEKSPVNLTDAANKKYVDDKFIVGTTGGEASLTTDGQLMIGSKTGTSLALDGDEIQARSGSVASQLLLQADGGNVGIGTTNPNAKLEVFGGVSGQSSALIAARGRANSFEWGHGNTAGYLSTLGFNSSNGRPYIAFNGEAGTNINTFRTRGIKSSIILSDIAGGLQFGNVATAAGTDNQTFVPLVTMLGTGNVGIGSTIPNVKLEVSGGNTYLQATSIGRSGVHYQEIGHNVGFTGTSDTYTYRSTDSAASMRMGFDGFEFRTASSGPAGTTLTLNEKMRITSQGNVGIGTATPQSALQVNGYIQLALGAPPVADCDASTERGRMKVDDTGDGTLYICVANGWRKAKLVP